MPSGGWILASRQVPGLEETFEAPQGCPPSWGSPGDSQVQSLSHTLPLPVPLEAAKKPSVSPLTTFPLVVEGMPSLPYFPLSLPRWTCAVPRLE